MYKVLSKDIIEKEILPHLSAAKNQIVLMDILGL